MMAKVGKFSTGLGGEPKKAASPYGMSNKGWESRSMMQDEGKKAIKMQKNGTATGNDVPVYKNK